ncbi:MAG: hypothetical protein IKW37_06065 [Bacteroidaceae bacterium]|nr:hypothetical protein [Bacteroidaceae bacterium]
MKTLYLFNPENDMALASASPYYMVPSNIKKMSADLSALPAWYAPVGSDVLLADERQKEWMEKESRFSLQMGWSVGLSLYYIKVYPWGWNPALIRSLKDADIAQEAMLTDEQMEKVRQLSNRQTAVDLLPRLRMEQTLGESFAFTSFEKLLAFLEKDEELLLKSPWSGSGKGIQKVKGGLEAPVYGWAKRVISTQGSIVVEPFYQKVVDFAMEFYSDGERVSFVGYSLFEADCRGIYKENVLASDQAIETRLASYVPLEVLWEIRKRCEEELGLLMSGAYVGYLGVDMMICEEDGMYKVHPCVEVNLRMNMGVVSHLLYDNYVCQGAEGRYVIEYFPKNGEALRFHEAMKEEYPLEMENGRIKRGYLSLTPVFDDTSYQIFIKIK